MKKILYLFKKCLPAIFLVGCLLVTDAYAGGVGTTGTQFLKISPGPRPSSMGDAFVAVADDSNACWWNAAGLAHLTNKEFGFVYALWFQEINYQYLCYVHPAGIFGTFGLGVTYLTVGDIIRTDVDEFGQLVETNEKFNAHDMSAALSYGVKFQNMFSLGIILKYISQDIEAEKSTGGAVDLCFLSKIGKRFKIGAVAQNIAGQQTTFVSEGDPLPLNYKVGVGILVKDKTTVAVDVNLPEERESNVHLGVECWLSDGFSLRAGYRTEVSEDIEGSTAGLSAGVGIITGNLNIDFAIVPYGDIGNTFRLGLNIKFGSKSPEPEPLKTRRTYRRYPRRRTYTETDLPY